MNRCPCEQCISYAMCVGKTTIECEDFYMYTSHIEVNYSQTNNSPYNIDDYWKYINSILPKTTRILSGRNTI